MAQMGGQLPGNINIDQALDAYSQIENSVDKAGNFVNSQ